MEQFSNYIESRITVVEDEKIRLGPTSFRLVSNVEDFPALQYFSKTAREPYQNKKTAFELWCISLRKDPIDKQYILSHIDRNYRGNSFSDGYYVTDHFGPCIYLVTKGQKFFVFGENLEHVVWPYFVKYFLMRHSIQDGSLFLKSAACAFGSKGTLLLGRGGSGKTVFLSSLCKYGAQFVTNSHSIVKDGHIYGVASSLRVRPDAWWSNFTENVKKKPALKSGEIIIDPYDIFDSCADETVELHNLCIIDFKEPGYHFIEPLPELEAYNLAEQFSLSINVYRLEEDLLDFYGDDPWKFSDVYNEMKTLLWKAIRRSRCYYISSDLFEQKYRDEVIELLST
jgi:hypothetical protein